MDPTKETAFNNRLRDLYGLYYDGQPLYRIVWSDSQIENRFGTFEKWKSGIYLGSHTGIAEVPKYPWIKERWVLERREGHTPNPELPETISYEPKWVFENEQGPVEPEWWAIEQLVHCITNPRKRFASDDKYDKNLMGSPAQAEIERQRVMDVLDDEISDIQTALECGEGIVVPEIKNGI